MGGFAVNFDEIKADLEKRLKEKRFIHSLGVVKAAIYLAKRYNVDEEKAKLAAILHDCGRCYSNEEIPLIAKKMEIKLSILEEISPVLIHAHVGKVLAKTRYNIKDESILNAISMHTVAGRNMDDLAKIIYIADMIEENRKFKGVDELREMTKTLPLDELFYNALNHTIKYILDLNQTLHLDTVKARNEIIIKRNCTK